MSNKKQTAMQEFLLELNRRLSIINSEPDGLARETMISNLLMDSDRYLAIEKEQIENAWNNGANDDDNWGEEYYNETYEK